MRLVLTSWGKDLARSRALVEELRIAEKTLWLPIASKPIVRARQQAADIMVDQLTMGSFGTSVVESLAAGKPVVMRLEPPHMALGGYQLPPVISATSEEEVSAALAELAEPRRRDDIGRRGRDWAVANRSYATRAEPFARELVEMVYQ